MSENARPFCPECEQNTEEQAGFDRRQFLRTAGVTALAAAGAAGLPRLATAADGKAETKKPARPAEEMVRELYASLKDEQKKAVVLPYDHGAKGDDFPTRKRMYNGPIGGKRIGDVYTEPQQELIAKILQAISSGEEGYRLFTRNGTFDGSKSLQGCGATIFGEPAEGKKWAWVFTGHHLTVRCDGIWTDGVAFGGPIYYGHSPNGYSPNNCFNYQTKSVLSVFEALTEKQRKVAIVQGTPGEHEPSVRFRKKGERHPGISHGELNKAQQALVEKVMRDILSPYRKEDVDEVMDVIKKTGGMEKIHLAFYPDAKMNDKQPWHFWRLEGPGFVWNYRVLPHVHTYVNISSNV